jgi:hypothetical protein
VIETLPVPDLDLNSQSVVVDQTANLESAA